MLSLEKFINTSNILGQPYILKPGRGVVHLPVNFSDAEKLLKQEAAAKPKQGRRELPDFIRREHDRLPQYNYSPIPFVDLHKRQFLALTIVKPNGDLFEG